jgi:hypothetical protein
VRHVRGSFRDWLHPETIIEQEREWDYPRGEVASCLPITVSVFRNHVLLETPSLYKGVLAYQSLTKV